MTRSTLGLSAPDQRSVGAKAMARRGRPGFTLLELALVMGLLAILVVLAWPLMESQIRASDLPDSAERLRSALFMARSTAVMEHRRVRVNFHESSQQPTFEWEKDPIREAGVFEALDAAWTREAILTGDVRVSRVVPGRPFFTKAVSKDADPAVMEEEIKQFFNPDEEESQFDAENPDSGISAQVYFEADGSSPWTTIIVAEIEANKELDEDTPQRWIVLDGRTGLARVQEPVREEQIADAAFFVEREKLEPPELKATDSLQAMSGDTTGTGGAGAPIGGAGDGTGLTGAGGAANFGGGFGGGGQMPAMGGSAVGADGGFGRRRGGGEGGPGGATADGFGRGGGRRGEGRGDNGGFDRGGDDSSTQGRRGRRGGGEGFEGGNQGRRPEGERGGGRRDRGDPDSMERRDGGRRGGDDRDGGRDDDRPRGNRPTQQEIEEFEEMLRNTPDMTEAEKSEMRRTFLEGTQDGDDDQF